MKRKALSVSLCTKEIGLSVEKENPSHVAEV